MFKAVKKHRFYHWTKGMLEDYNHTMELRMLGTRLVMTDDPENIKAIQDTQVLYQYELTMEIISNEFSSGRLPNRKNNIRFSNISLVMLFLQVSGLGVILRNELLISLSRSEW